MTTKQRILENEVHDDIYKSGFLFKLKVATISIVTFFATLLYFYPVEENINKILSNALKANPRCPIAYDKLKFSLFLPTVSLSKITVPGRCIGPKNKDLNIQTAQFKLTVPTLWPPGIKSHLMIKQKKSVLNIYPKITFLGHEARITSSKLTGAFLSSLGPYPELLTGNIHVDGLFKFTNSQIKSGNFKVTSKNLAIPAQNISGFDIMPLPLKKLQLTASITGRKVNIKALKLGTPKSPLQAQFAGNIDLVKSNPRFSKLKLNGKFRLGDEVFKSIPILDLFLGSKKKVDGFFPISIGGTIAKPATKFLSK